MRQDGEAARGEEVELAPRERDVAALGRRLGQADAIGGRGDTLVDQRAQRVGQLAESPLEPAQAEELPEIHRCGDVTLHPLTGGERLPGELLGACEGTVEARPHGAPHQALPAIQRVAHLLGDAGHRGDLAIRRHHVTALEQAHHLPATRLELEVPVAVRQGQRQDLVGSGEPLLDAARSPQRLQAEVERERESRRVAETACHRHRVPAERVPALGAV